MRERKQNEIIVPHRHPPRKGGIHKLNNGQCFTTAMDSAVKPRNDGGRLKQNGIGLLELLLALAVIAILLIMAMRYYTVASLSRKVTQDFETVQAVEAAGHRWLLTNGDFSAITGIPILQEHDLLSASFNATNQWGGAITAKGSSSSLFLTIASDNLPSDACNSLANKLAETACAPSGVSAATCAKKGKKYQLTVKLYPCTQ